MTKLTSCQESTEVRSVFVYGTLKVGFELSHIWPKKPERIVTGKIPGKLLNLGPYPAAIEAPGFLLGELWQFTLDNIPTVLEVLDEAEEYSSSRPDALNLYVRKIVTVSTEDGDEKAFAYFLANPCRFPNAPEVLTREIFLNASCQIWNTQLSEIETSDRCNRSF